MPEHQPKKSPNSQQQPHLPQQKLPETSPVADVSAILRAIQSPNRQTLPPKTMMQLQRLVGNQATQKLVMRVNQSPPLAKVSGLKQNPVHSNFHTAQRSFTVEDVHGHTRNIDGQLSNSLRASLEQNFHASPEAILVLDQWSRGVRHMTFHTWNHAVAEAENEVNRRKYGDYGDLIDVQNNISEGGEPILGVEEFEELPHTGTINPYRLRIAQGGIEMKFRDGRKLMDTVALLVDNPRITEEIPPVNIGIHLGRVWAFDTRRVVAHQMAREKNEAVVIRYVKIADEDKEERVSSIFTARPYMGLVTAVRYLGKKSGSQAYINPQYRSFIESDVLPSWSGYEGFIEMSEKVTPFDYTEKLKQMRESVKGNEESLNNDVRAVVRKLREIFPNFDLNTIKKELRQLFLLSLEASDPIASTIDAACVLILKKQEEIASQQV